MKTSGLFVFLFFGIQVTFAQITITQSDLGDVGDQIIYGNPDMMGSVPAPAPGPNQSYSFLYSDTSFLDTTIYISPASTPFATLMAGSTLAENNEGAYAFYTKNSAGYYLNGVVFDFPLEGLGLPFSQVPLKFTPPVPILQFPATTGQNLVSQSTSRFEFDYDTVISVNGVNATVSKVGVVATVYDTSIIDGYGNAEFVSQTLPVLRNQQGFKISFKIQVLAKILFFPASWIDLPANLLPGGIPDIYDKSLQFWANGKKGPVASFSLDSANNISGPRILKELLVTSNRSLVSVKKGFEFTPAPNPARNFVSFNTSEEIKNVVLFSLEGQKIWSQKITDGEKGISVSNLASGIYLMELENQKGKLSRKKLVVSE